MRKKKSSTCLAAIKHKNKIYMAADRRVTWDVGQVQKMPRPKISKRDGLILAGTGDLYLVQLVVDRLQIPEYNGDTDDYMYEKLHRSIINLLLRKGFSDREKNLRISPDEEAEIIVAIKGRLYTIEISNPAPHVLDHSNGQVSVGEVNVPYASGCGGHLAWGSLLTTESMDMKPRDRLQIALEVAAQVSPGCDNFVDQVNE